MMLRKLVKRGYRSKFLHIVDSNETNTNSGIRATLFGSTGCVGHALVHKLGTIGSDMILPTRFTKPYEDKIKLLKHESEQSMTYVMYHFNYNDPLAISRSISKSNIAVNMTGPTRRMSKLKDFEFVNIEVPYRIAKEAKKRGLKKFIHFSSVGVDPDSESFDLRTKFHGEKVVREEFPEAVIIRPTTVIGYDDHTRAIFSRVQEYCFSFVPFHGDLQAMRQPITDIDLSLAVFNAIKMDEANGNTYEIGGPNVYTRKEFYEILINCVKRPMSLVRVPPSFAKGFTTYLNTLYLNREDIRKDELDLVAVKREGVKTIEDLYVKPASVVHFLEKTLAYEATNMLNSADDKQATR